MEYTFRVTDPLDRTIELRGIKVDHHSRECNCIQMSCLLQKQVSKIFFVVIPKEGVLGNLPTTLETTMVMFKI